MLGVFGFTYVWLWWYMLARCGFVLICVAGLWGSLALRCFLVLFVVLLPWILGWVVGIVGLTAVMNLWLVV